MQSKFHPHHEKIVQWAAEGRTLQYMAEQIGGVSLGGVRKYCIQQCIPHQTKRGWRHGSHTGADHPRWQGGRQKVGDYIRVKAPDHPNADRRGMMAEHRLVMEASIGRLLTRKEVVHHDDTNKTNNVPGNLILHASNGDHISQEHSGRAMSQAQKQALSVVHKGSKRPPRSQEYRAKMSAAHKGRPKSESHRAALAQAALNRPAPTLEQRTRMSAAQKASHAANPGRHEKAIPAMNAARKQQAAQARRQTDEPTRQETESDGLPPPQPRRQTTSEP